MNHIRLCDLTIRQSYFCLVRRTQNSFALAMGAVCNFSSRAAALVSRVSRLRYSTRARACTPLAKFAKKERPLTVASKLPELSKCLSPNKGYFPHSLLITLTSKLRTIGCLLYYYNLCICRIFLPIAYLHELFHCLLQFTKFRSSFIN